MVSRKSYDQNFFKKWSREMAYVLGFMFADGNLTINKQGYSYVAIYTADRELLFMMTACMKAEHKIAERKSATGAVYRVQIGSRQWATDLKQLGLTPGKAKRMRLPEIPSAYFGDFVRGYFDGDGNVWTGLIHRRRKSQHLSNQVSFTSGSLEYLHSLLQGLRRCGIAGGSLFMIKSKQCGRLTFSKKDALKIYRIMYNSPHKLYLKRKKDVFDKFVKSDNAGVAQLV